MRGTRGGRAVVRHERLAVRLAQDVRREVKLRVGNSCGGRAVAGPCGRLLRDQAREGGRVRGERERRVRWRILEVEVGGQARWPGSGRLALVAGAGARQGRRERGSQEGGREGSLVVPHAPAVHAQEGTPPFVPLCIHRSTTFVLSCMGPTEPSSRRRWPVCCMAA